MLPWILPNGGRVRLPENTLAVFLGKMEISLGLYDLSQLNYVRTQMLLMFLVFLKYILQLSQGLWCRMQPWISAKEGRVRHPLNTRAVFLGKMDFSFRPYALSQLNYTRTQMLLMFHILSDYILQLSPERNPEFLQKKIEWDFHGTLGLYFWGKWRSVWGYMIWANWIK